MNKNNAFTLVELSIVLVIIGLIVGGVVGGQSLIRSAKVNSLISELGEYEIAVRSFGLQYDALPGDMTEAYDYWGTDCGTDAYVTTTEGCNGNGDGKILNSAYDVSYEPFMAIKHLALAGLIKGSYTGYGYTVNNYQPGVNVPISGFSNEVGAFISESPFFEATGITFSEANTDNSSSGPFLSTAEAKMIDKKIDDGDPEGGKLRGVHGRSAHGSDLSGCYDSDGYQLSNTDNKSCLIVNRIAN